MTYDWMVSQSHESAVLRAEIDKLVYEDVPIGQARVASDNEDVVMMRDAQGGKAEINISKDRALSLLDAFDTELSSLGAGSGDTG